MLLKFLKSCFLVLCLLVIGGFRFHPYFVSMTELTYNPKEKKIEASVRIFTDDLEKALAKDCMCKVDLVDPAQKDQNSKILSQYLSRKIKLTLDGKSSSLSFIGFEKEEESTWSYLQTEEVNLPSKVLVENQLLYETQPKQSNLVRLKLGKLDKTTQLNYPETRVEF